MISDFENAGLLPPSPVERVLVIPRSTFEEQGAFQGFRVLAGRDDLGVYLQSAPFRRAAFMDKPAAELDPRFKQLLP
jgi:predicted NUDIX family phosphoesterase